MKNETLKNMAGIILFYLLIVLGVLALNARMGNINESSGVVSLTSISGN